MCTVSPEDLYVRVRQLAQSRSLADSLCTQVVTILYEALDKEEQSNDQMGTLAHIRRRRFAPAKAVSSLGLLREDRQ